MPEYLSPGVYVEELQTGPRPIEGVSTSTAGFVGMTERGPESAVLLTSWLDFQRWFGGYLPIDQSYLPYVVQGFFDNGGQRLYVARIIPGASPDPTKQGVAPVRAAATFGDLEISATGRGDWGDRIFVAVERATQAATSANAANWVKLSVVYFANAPATKDTAVSRAVMAAAAAAADKDVVKAVADSKKAGADAKGNATDKDLANKFAAAAALAAEKAAAVYTAAQAALDLATAAADASPTNSAAARAKSDAKTMRDNAKKLNDDADKANKGAVDNAKNPAQNTVDPAAQASADADADLNGQNGLVNTAMGQLGPAVANAQQTAQDAATAAASALADPTNPDKAKAVQDAAKAAKAAADTANTAATTFKNNADADAAANPNDQAKQTAKNAADKAATDAGKAATEAGNAVTAANTYQGAPTPANAQAASDAIGKALTAVNTAADSANTAAAQVALAGGTPNLAVSPLRPENRKDPGFRAAQVVEVYDNVRLTPHASNSLDTTVNAASRLIHVTVNGTNVPLSPTGKGADGKNEAVFGGLTGGMAGTQTTGTPPATTTLTMPTLLDYQGNLDPIDNDPNSAYGIGMGLAALAAVDGISLLAAPDEVIFGPPLTNEIINQCELMRDRFGIVSAMGGQGPSQVQNLRPPQDTTWAAFYWPWMQIFDPVSSASMLIPPTGHITGLIANVDIQRGVHKAPANEVLRDATDLEFPVTKGMQDILNPIGVNCIRDFRDSERGIRVWGARTMSSDPQWKYINVRRLFIFIEQSIYKGTQWAVFEPNDEPLWAQVRRAISNFLVRVWKSGALMGETQEQAFFVKCDLTTMTQDDIDNGRMVCLIGIAPTKPAEFVIFRISQLTLDAQQ